jgi:hypothetical protein
LINVAQAIDHNSFLTYLIENTFKKLLTSTK